MPSTIAQRFAENTEALNTLTLAVQSAIATSSSVGGRPVDLTGLVDGVLLQYQAAGNKWVVITPDTLKLALDLPANFAVDLTGVADGYTLAWDAAQSRFEPIPPLGNTGGGAAVAANIASIQVASGVTKTVSLGIVDTTSQVQDAGASTVPKPLIPVLTSDISASPILVGSRDRAYNVIKPDRIPYSDQSTWQIFDQSIDTAVVLSPFSSTPTSYPTWVIVSFGSPTRVTSYSVQVAIGTYPTNWTLQGKDGTLANFQDDSGWTTVDTQSIAVSGGNAWKSYETKVFALSTAQTYRHWRFRITGTSDTLYVHPVIAGFQLFGGASATGSVTASVAAGPQRAVYESRVFAVAADDDRVIATVGSDEGSDRIFAIDSTSKAITQDFSLSGGSIYQVQYNLLAPNNAFLYSTATEASGRVAVQASENRAYVAAGSQILEVAIDAQTTTVIDVGGTSFIEGLAVVGGKLYAVDRANNRVAVIDRATRTQTTTVTVGSSPIGIDFDSVQQTLFVANSGSNNVTLISSVTDTPITTVAVGSFPIGVGVDSVLGRAVVANRGSGNVTILNTISGAAVGSVAIGTTARPVSVAIDSANGRAFVACEGYHQLVAIRLSDNQRVARIPVAPEPISATFVAATSEVYVASRDGAISVVKSLAG
ncbi:YncE family protein [Limnothrix sp. FACHB-1083]|uniref:YncE family protein n=1 Tax=unclassified Limnothrix TaxID=2632864 RepID=UPI001681925F|nr:MULTISPECIES: YncE family protein [unclassified Limnothrix]MBD2161432.1 YncE family protein [Limnothrix sp. FACHB-1083]MBD2192057.1 YncE family protein [Limnothrix sp. FACHB-1088]